MYAEGIKRGKNLVDRGKKLLHFLEEDLSFNLHQELTSYLKISTNQMQIKLKKLPIHGLSWETT